MVEKKLSVRDKSINNALKRKRTKKIVSITTWSIVAVSIIMIVILR